MVDYRRAWAAIRQDPKWVRKLALGALINLIPYVGAVWLIGWQLEYQRSVAWGDDRRLPAWSDFSGQAMQGLRAYVAILPYSFIVGLLAVPAALLIPFSAGLSSSSDASNVGLVVTVSVIVELIAVVGGILLLAPLMYAAMLRVALYGTFEAGFQYAEIRRLMKEGKRDLLRAWGYTSINMFMLFATVICYFGLIALAIALIPGEWPQKGALSMVLLFGGYLVYIVLASVLGLYVGLVNMHLFGCYGRAAYRLDALEVPHTAAVSETPA